MRERLRDWLRGLLPRYAILPLIAVLLLNLAVYYGPRAYHLLFGAQYVSMVLPVDEHLPFVPFFIVFYVGAYVIWYLNFAMIARERPERCGVLFGEMIAKLLCMLIFFLMPTTMERAEITGNGLFERLTALIYAMDTPDNLFPSIHCLENWVGWRGLWGCRRTGRGYKAFSLICCLLTFASVLLVKQHVLVDIPAAILVGEMGMYASKKLRLGERYAAWCKERGWLLEEA